MPQMISSNPPVLFPVLAGHIVFVALRQSCLGNSLQCVQDLQDPQDQREFTMASDRCPLGAGAFKFSEGCGASWLVSQFMRRIAPITRIGLRGTLGQLQCARLVC
ncbi:MAG: hypothetical protein ACR2PG_21940, partial [Hyphomicrobiaceae bacterium]